MRRLLLLCIFCFALAQTAVADDTRGSARQAQLMVEHAIALFDADGIIAFRAISRDPPPDFRDRDLYVFVFDRRGTMAAHALHPESVGRNAINAHDSDGRFYIREMISRATESGVWVDYVFMDPLLGVPAPKSAWVVLHDGFLFVCGIYAGELGI